MDARAHSPFLLSHVATVAPDGWHPHAEHVAVGATRNKGFFATLVVLRVEYFIPPSCRCDRVRWSDVRSYMAYGGSIARHWRHAASPCTCWVGNTCIIVHSWSIFAASNGCSSPSF